MQSLLSSVLALLISVALLSLAVGMFGTFLGLRASIEGLSNEIIGLMSSGYYAAFIAGSLICGRMINAIGHTRAFAVLASINAALVVAFPLSDWPPLWIALRAATGFCIAGIYVVIESWLNARANPSNRGTLLSLYLIVTYGGLGTGQFLLNLADPHNDRLFLIATILFSLMAVPLSLSRAKMPVLPQTRVRLSIMELLRGAPVGTSACVWSGISCGAVYGLGPIFAQDLGLEVSQIAQFMSALVMSGLLLQYPVGRLSDRFDRRAVLVWVCLLIVVTCAGMHALLLYFNGSGLQLWYGARYWLLGLAALYGGLSFTVYPLGVSMANDQVRPEQMVPAAGLLLISYSIGATLGPAAVAWLMEYIGPIGLFALPGASAVLLGVLSLWRLLRYPELLPREGRDDPVPLPESTPRALEIGASAVRPGEPG